MTILFLTYIFYDDDTKMFNNIDQTHDSHQQKEDVWEIEQWSEKWLLHFHLRKCKMLDISLRDRLSYEYYLGNIRLDQPDEEQDLGV